jgi:hypothetical protein
MKWLRERATIGLLLLTLAFSIVGWARSFVIWDRLDIYVDRGDWYLELKIGSSNGSLWISTADVYRTHMIREQTQTQYSWSFMSVRRESSYKPWLQMRVSRGRTSLYVDIALPYFVLILLSAGILIARKLIWCRTQRGFPVEVESNPQNAQDAEKGSLLI